MTTTFEGKTAAEWRDEGHGARAEREASFERCDTDGFLSQWASGISASLCGLKAELAETGGKSEFPGLFVKATGERAKAKLIEGKFGMCWAFLDASGRFTGEFLGDSRGPRSKLSKAGYEVKMEWAPAVAKIIGTGKGLSGQAWAAILRVDGGCPA